MKLKSPLSLALFASVCFGSIEVSQADASGYWMPLIATDGEETFVMTDELDEPVVMRAVAPCPDVAEPGDRLFFLSNPLSCETNTFFNPRTELSCDLWCD